MTGGRVRPYDFANILFAGPCNLRCPYCIGLQLDPALNRDNLDEFPVRNLEPFVELLRRYRVDQVVFTGTNTDPQLYRHEARMIDWLREQLPQAQLSLHTNGQLALAKMDVFNRYDRVSLSFPSFEPDIYERMSGSRRVPDVAAIVEAARVPVKVSCVVTEDNVGRMAAFLARCREIGIQRVVLRRPYGDQGHWRIPDETKSLGLTPVTTYRANPVYDYHGLKITLWHFHGTTSTSLNLFSDGTISTEYLLSKTRAE